MLFAHTKPCSSIAKLPGPFIRLSLFCSLLKLPVILRKSSQYVGRCVSVGWYVAFACDNRKIGSLAFDG